MGRGYEEQNPEARESHGEGGWGFAQEHSWGNGMGLFFLSQVEPHSLYLPESWVIGVMKRDPAVGECI